MNLIFLGSPGAGKGTQADQLNIKYGWPKISTGDILRRAREDQTPLGQKADQYMQQGLLVPDEVVIGIVEERIKESDCQDGFVLDGFPRTVGQAEALDQMLMARSRGIQVVLNMVVPQSMLVERLTGRRVCQSCGATYHLVYNPPQTQSKCDRCGGGLMLRRDDEPETVLARLQVFESSTRPLVDYYKSKDILADVDGTGSMDEVWNQIQSIVSRFQKSEI